MIEWKSPKGKMTVVLYDSPDDMPMDLYFLSGQYGLLDAEAGSEMPDVNRKFEKMDMFIMNNMRDELIQERHNLHQTFYNIQNEIHFPSLYFGCHIESVDGKLITDRSTQNLMRIMKNMGRNGFTFKSLRELIDDIKKKFSRELALMFPDKYGNSNKLNYLSQVRAKIIAEQNYILTGEHVYIQEIKNIYDYFLGALRPRNIDWSGPNAKSNVVVEAKIAYEKLCSVLMKSGIQTPGQLSVVKFQITVETYESKRRTKSK
jgi:hypothetical protein